MLLHILYLWSKIQISSQDTQRKISEQTEKNNSCLFQQGFPFVWSKFSYFHPCQINLQAPPMPEHLRLVKQVSFIHVQHWKSSKKNNYSAQVLFKWNASMRMRWKFRCEVALTTCPLHGETRIHWTLPALEMPSVLLQIFCYTHYGKEGLSLDDYFMETELLHPLEKLELENFSRHSASVS